MDSQGDDVVGRCILLYFISMIISFSVWILRVMMLLVVAFYITNPNHKIDMCLREKFNFLSDEFDTISMYFHTFILLV